MGAAGGVERFEDLHDLPVRLLQGPSVDSARLWSKTSSEAPEGPLVSDRHDRPTTPAEKGDQLSAERELTCPPTGILGCPRSPPNLGRFKPHSLALCCRQRGASRFQRLVTRAEASG